MWGFVRAYRSASTSSTLALYGGTVEARRPIQVFISAIGSQIVPLNLYRGFHELVRCTISGLEDLLLLLMSGNAWAEGYGI